MEFDELPLHATYTTCRCSAGRCPAVTLDGSQDQVLDLLRKRIEAEWRRRTSAAR